MTTQGYISTKGFEEFLEKIVEAGRDIDEAAAIALIEGCEVLKEGMQQRVPKDSWNLHDHIQIDGPHQEGNYVYAEVGVIHKKQFTDAETARYGNVQEYGHIEDAPNAVETEFGTVRDSAQPYIRPTLKEDKNKARSAIRKSLK